MREEDLGGGIGGVEGGVGDAHAIFTHAPVTRPRPTDLAHVKYWRIFSSSVPLSCRSGLPTAAGGQPRRHGSAIPQLRMSALRSRARLFSA